MNREKFIKTIAGSILISGTACYLFSDKNNLIRPNSIEFSSGNFPLNKDEIEILTLASLAPSGHNTQPWFVKYHEPYNWTICNDKSKWLPEIDSTQRETLLSIGAFVQNLIVASKSFGYTCNYNIIAECNQDVEIVQIILVKSTNKETFDTTKIKMRRTIRSNFLMEKLKEVDSKFLIDNQSDYIHYLPNSSKEFHLLNELTIEANRVQSYDNRAQKELSDWIRISSKEVGKSMDGLSTASMDINGFSGWIVRNFYNKSSIMSTNFREQGIEKVKQQVANSAGWILITCKQNSVKSLIETGMRMERLFLEVRGKQIAIHPMSQVLEEPLIKQTMRTEIGISDELQFILRTGYLENYPDPVSFRRPLSAFLRMESV